MMNVEEDDRKPAATAADDDDDSDVEMEGEFCCWYICVWYALNEYHHYGVGVLQKIKHGTPESPLKLKYNLTLISITLLLY